MIDIARRFAAYIPVTLVRQLLHEGLPEPGQPRPLLAATLFSDISGFTKMSEELASDGPRGAEELNRVLLMTFTAMIDVIHEMGGAVSHFYGDAMSVYFPETGLGDAARRALACAQLMQKVMAASFDRIVTNRPVGKDPFFSLTIKIGVGYGRCQEMVVGDSNSTLEFVLTGTAVDEAAAAEKLAKAGQVVASARVMAQADLAFLCQESDFCVVVDKVPTVTPQPIIEWSAYDETALSYLVAASGAFIPAAIAKRLERGSQGEIAEHRPVTSMFVDFSFVGNVDDASDVETAVHGQHLHDYYLWASDIVARFGGQNARVNRILTGDKGNQLHIIFGAPVAPDAPEQAMRCAMTLVREKPDFIAMQRIGLAAGKVFAGPVGSTTRREYTVVGDIVNLSARLAQVCSENCVFTNSNTAARVDNWIEFEVLPPVFLKGKQEAISPYKPVSERSGLTQLQAYFSHWERPLVGRDAELDLLLGGMDAAVRGIGGVAAILGAVGVGKTHLLAEGIRYWLDEGGTGLVGVAQQHKSDVPYGPWLDIWRDFFNLRTDMSTAAQAEQVVAQTRALLPDVSDDVALWGEVLGLPISGQEQLLELSAEVKQSRFISLVRRCFFAFSDLTPLLIILEDAHWADQSSLALLDEITRSLDGHKIFFAATFRLADELSMDLLDRSSCVPILVADLSPAHARVLLAQLIGVSQLPQAVEQHLGLRDREGRDSPVSPLFLEESINMMIGTGVLTLDGQVHVHEERLQTLQIPDTIHGLLLARLDRLPPAGRDLLQVASVIGRQFALEPLHNIAFDVPEQNISSLLEELSSEDITRLVMSDPEWIYLFQHALTHEVAYESLPYARRQSLHQAMADWLVARYMDNLRSYYPILAYHYSQAGNHKAGLRYALAAGLDARALFSNHEALGFFNQAEKHLLAVGEAENWETAVTLYLARSEVFLHLGDFTRAIEDVEHSYRHAAAHDLYEQMAQANNKLAELKWRQTKYDEIAAFSSKVLEMRSQISSNEIARAYQLTGLADASLGHYESALENLHIAESLCLETQNRAQLARVLEIIGFVHYTRKELALALDAIKRSVALSRDASTPVNVASSLSNISLIHFRLGQVVSSLETINEAIQLVTAESQTFLTTFLLNRAEILCYLGEFQSARFDFDEVARHFTKADDHRGLLEFYLLQGFDYYAAQNKWE
ncbi:MAG: AAA family ATPase, partial [Anaerolineae bacterium]|nr:AAA family ATPase [Anaerolineae bacterium]